MGYFMRFILTDGAPVSVRDLETGLLALDDKYSLVRDEEVELEAELYYGHEIYGEIEINVPGDDTFEEEIEELVESVEDSEGQGKARVIDVLRSTECLCCIRVLPGGRETEDTLSRIDPIWSWFFRNRSGLLQADGEGYYDSTGLVLEVR